VRPQAADPTSLLAAHAAGDRVATERLFLLLYDRLHRLARKRMRRERADHTLQPTALVHETYLRMIGARGVDWGSKTHFFAAAAVQMRRILVEHARAARRLKRGGNAVRVTLDEAVGADPRQPVDVLALDHELERLARRHGRQARVAELRLFAGMEVKEVSHLLGVSERTVKQDWSVAQAWLAHRLGP
jgi:RNA polymerase sigma factor (TIGR02999 family)